MIKLEKATGLDARQADNVFVLFRLGIQFNYLACWLCMQQQQEISSRLLIWASGICFFVNLE